MNTVLLDRAVWHASNGIFNGIYFINGMLTDANAVPVTDALILATFKVFLGQHLTVTEAELVLDRPLTEGEKGVL